MPFLFDVKGFFCHLLNEHDFELNTGSIQSASSPGYDKLYKKAI